MVDTISVAPSPLSARSKFIVMGCTMLGLFLSAMDQTVVGTAMPRVIASLGGLDLFSWVFTAYMLTSTTSVPIVGKLSDLYGRKRFYLTGIVVFLAASALAGTSQNMVQLITFRGIQGIGGGFIMANAFALVGDLFPPAERGRYAGLMTGVFGLASVLGPLIGGGITDSLSWRWVFYANLPLGFVTIAALYLFLPNIGVRAQRAKVDYLGAATLAAGVAPLLLALAWAGNDYAWDSPQVVGLLGVSAMMLSLFLLIESRAEEHIIPSRLFCSPIFAVAVAVTFLTGIALFGNSLLIPLFMQGVVGTSATNSGLVMTPMTLSMVVGATIGGQVISRTGRYVLVTVVGMAAMVGGTFLLSRMGVDTAQFTAVRNMAVVGFGLGLTMPSLVIAVQNAFPYHLLGVVTSSITFFRSIGGTLGVAILGSLLTSRLGSELSTNIPADVRETAPPALLERISDPQLLLSPGAMARLRDVSTQLGGEAATAFERVIGALRLSLADSIGHAYVFAVIVIALAFGVSLFLRDVPRRKTVETAPAAMAGLGPQALAAVDPSASSLDSPEEGTVAADAPLESWSPLPPRRSGLP